MNRVLMMLIDINESIISENINNDDIRKKHETIRKILNTKDCFLNMSIEYAFAILRDLGVLESDLDTTYMSLINP